MHRYRKLLKVKDCEDIGSGSEPALLFLVQIWKEYKCGVRMDMGVRIMCWAFLHAGLTDLYSGGLFTGNILLRTDIIIKNSYLELKSSTVKPL